MTGGVCKPSASKEAVNDNPKGGRPGRAALREGIAAKGPEGHKAKPVGSGRKGRGRKRRRSDGRQTGYAHSGNATRGRTEAVIWKGCAI